MLTGNFLDDVNILRDLCLGSQNVYDDVQKFTWNLTSPSSWMHSEISCNGGNMAHIVAPEPNHRCLQGARWVMKFPIDFVIDENLFNELTFSFRVGGIAIEEQSVIMMPIVNALHQGKAWRIEKTTNDTCVIYKINLLFDAINVSHVLPTAHATEILVGNSTLNRFVDVDQSVECTFSNATRVVAANGNALAGERRTRGYITQMKYFTSKGSNSFIFGDFSHPTAGLYFAFVDPHTGIVIKEDGLIANVRLKFSVSPDHEYSVEAHQKCPQFQHTVFPVDQGLFDLANAKSVIFPIEVWATIIAHLDHPIPLLHSCKYLYKVGQTSLVRNILTSVYDQRVGGWYCIPFNTELKTPFAKRKTVNLSRTDNFTLSFDMPTTGKRMDIVMVSYHTNVIRFMNEMMGLAYTN